MTFWGTAIFLAAIASRKTGNVLTLFWMQLFGFIIAFIYLILGPASLNFSALTQNAPVLIGIAFLQVYAYLSFYRGLEKANVSLVGPIGAAWGLVVAILGIAFLGETLDPLQAVAVSLIVVGIVMLSVDLRSFLKLKKVNILTGVQEGMGAMFGWGVSLFLLVFPAKQLGWFIPTFVFRFLVIIILVGYIVATGRKFVPRKAEAPFKLLLLIGLFDVGGFFAYSLGVAGEQASVVGPIASAFALVSVILAKIFLKEKLDRNKLAGILAITSGLVLISI